MALTREELIELGRDAMGRSDSWRWWAPRHLERLLNVWEPRIRADERAVAEVAWPRMKASVRGDVAEQIRAVAADPDRRRPLRKDAETATDFADDMEWAAMIAEGSWTP